ncbi:hypothetical protein GIB67_000800, partial [Kingdonia uniflora]
SSMRLKPINPMSKFIVSSSLEETSSSGRENDCNIIEETVDKIEVIIGVEARESSKVEKIIEEDDTQKGVMNVLQCCPTQLNGNVYEMMRVCEALNEKWKREGTAKHFEADDVLIFYKLKFVKGPNSGYLYSDSSRLKFLTSNLRATSLDTDKDSLKRKRHEGEGSNRTNAKATTKKRELEQKYCTMAGADPHQLHDMFQEQTLTLLMLMKGMTKFMEKRSQEFGELTRRLDAQAARMKELEDKLEIEKKKRVKHAKVVKERYIELSEYDEVILQACTALWAEIDCFIQSYYYFGLTAADVEQGQTSKYKEIVFASDAEDEVVTNASILANEVERLKNVVSTLEKSLSRTRDSLARVQQVLNKTEYQKLLVALTLYFEVKVDIEWGLKEAYVELLKENGVVPDPARVMFMAQEVPNRHRLEGNEDFVFQDKERVNRGAIEVRGIVDDVVLVEELNDSGANELRSIIDFDEMGAAKPYYDGFPYKLNNFIFTCATQRNYFYTLGEIVHYYYESFKAEARILGPCRWQVSYLLAYSMAWAFIFGQKTPCVRAQFAKDCPAFIGACKDPMVITTDLLPGMSLQKYMASFRPKQLDPSVAIGFAVGIVCAMECLHANGIIHRDHLKPDKLLQTENQESVKLADFGIAKEETVTEMMTAETRTYRWMAPDCSLNFVLSIILKIYSIFSSVEQNIKPELPGDINPKLAVIIQSCCAEDPNLHPSFGEVIPLLNAFLSALSPQTFFG